MKHRPRSTFGAVNADVLQHYYSAFVRDDCIDIILNSSWPEWSPSRQRGLPAAVMPTGSIYLRLDGLDEGLQRARGPDRVTAAG